MLTLSTIQGAIEPLTDMYEFKTKETTDGERSLSFYIVKTERNFLTFDLINGKESVIFEGEKYVIDLCDKDPVGNTVEKYVEAKHQMFDRTKVFHHQEVTGALRINRCLDIALAGTGLTYTVIGEFRSRDFENYGRALAQDMLKQIKNRFGVEYRVQGTHLTIAQEIARYTDAQARHAHNIRSISESLDVTDLATYIEGYGKPVEDDDGNPIPGQWRATAKYLSPNAHLYERVIHAEFVYDDRFVHDDSLLEYIISRLKDVPDYYLKIEYAELVKNGLKLHDYRLGDYIYIFHEVMGIKIQARIISIERYPLEPGRSPVIELGSFKKDITVMTANLQNQDKRVQAIENTVHGVNQSIGIVRTTAQEAKNLAQSGSGDIATHTSNQLIHVSTYDRDNWNAKADSGESEQDAAWALNEARNYTNQQIPLAEGRMKNYIDGKVQVIETEVSLLKAMYEELKSRLDEMDTE